MDVFQYRFLCHFHADLSPLVVVLRRLSVVSTHIYDAMMAICPPLKKYTLFIVNYLNEPQTREI